MRVRRAALEAIMAHARRDAPRECCGLLVGNDQEVVEAVPCANVSADPLRQYEVSPAEHLALIRRCREQSEAGSAGDVIGAYHSHPRTEAWPSPTDLEQACRDFLFIIAGPVDEQRDLAVRGYQLAGDPFEEVNLVVED
jgi:proteasome lid subunit RPN8/RPN11